MRKTIAEVWNERNDAGYGLPVGMPGMGLTEALLSDGWTLAWQATGGDDVYSVGTHGARVCVVADSHGTWGVIVEGVVVLPQYRGAVCVDLAGETCRTCGGTETDGVCITDCTRN